ncbi:MAG: NAD-dependent epimerase/dehydratase family protein [Chryseolinea sp.]
MKVIVIGGTGHVGTFLIPRLVKDGHQVIVISRQQHRPYVTSDAWQKVQWINLDRVKLESEGTFGQTVANLSPDVVIDMICFNLDSAQHLINALQDRVQHFFHCGTLWVHGYKLEIPSKESDPRRPIGDYGIKKAAIEEYLLNQVDQKRLPVTIIHPGHIVGPGWIPLNPQGNFNRDIYSRLSKGEEVLMPNLGLETSHHVHASDVASGFMQALNNKERAMGQSFHVLSNAALTWRGYAEAIAESYNQKANLRFVSWDEFRTSVSEADANSTWDHLIHSTIGSIEKARQLIGYEPEYTSLQAIQESLRSIGL